MGTLNLGPNGKVDGNAEFEGRVTKPAHPYLLCQSNANLDVNNNTNTLLTHFGNTRISQGGIAFNTSNGRITIQSQVYIEFVPEYAIVMRVGGETIIALLYS